MQADRIREDIYKILSSQQLGVLATYGSEYPYATIVGFAVTDDLSYILFATFRDTRKYENIQSDPHVSILIDSRSNRVEDFSKAQALTVLGSAEDVPENERQEYMSLYLQRYSHLREFISDPNCVLLKIKVHKYILVSRFQEVLELDIQ